MPDITDFQLGQGETFRLLLRLQNRSNNNTPIDISDYVFAGHVRENYTTDVIAAEFQFEKAVPHSSGSLVAFLTPAQTMELAQRRYVYDITMASGSSDPVKRRVLEGGLAVRPAVTR